MFIILKGQTASKKHPLISASVLLEGAVDMLRWLIR